jgi:uncharacterized protein (DUF58 family)
MERKELPYSAETNLHDLLETAYQVMPRRSLVFVVSDFISQPGWEKPLGQLARRHDVVVVRIYDPLEMALPDLGFLVVQDAETAEQLFVDTHDPAFRRRFAEIATQREEALRAGFAHANVDALELATDDSVMDALLRFSALRKGLSHLHAGHALPSHLEKR